MVVPLNELTVKESKNLTPVSAHSLKKCVGEFKDGKNWNTTGYDKNGNIIGKIINGVRQ